MEKLLTNIENHAFVIENSKDAIRYLGDKEIDFSDIVISEDVIFDELEYYVHKVGFHLSYLIKWCKQLKIGIEFLSNFEYKNNVEYNRIDHLSYNIENYIIRFQSVSDRILQLINAVFHLAISDNNVTNNVVMSNLKVDRTKVPLKYKPIKKYLKLFYNDRNTIVHRHSYLEIELKKLELFYHPNNDDIDERSKLFRANKLKEYIKDKKDYFNECNQGLFKLLPDLFQELLIEYKRKKEDLTILVRS
jgi:hypothetical protein